MVTPKHKKELRQGGLVNRLFQAKILAAILVGKTLIGLTHFLGRGGTTLPGRTALSIYPDLTTFLVRQLKAGIILVTGTNGKTTTASLLSGILKARTLKVIHNQSGSNMAWGIASTLLAAANWLGSLKSDWALLEADEGAFPNLVRATRPIGIITTNIFRDQLDRYGEIDLIQNAIGRGLENQPEGGFQVINADDPSLVSLTGETGKKRLTYGLELELPANNIHNTGRDLKTCPFCKTELTYDRVYFAHLGHYHCSNCSFKRPVPDVQLTGYQSRSDGSAQLEIKTGKDLVSLNSPLPGIYNLYNLLAALTCALALKIPGAFATAVLEQADPAFGRMELFAVNDKQLIMALIKNPVGANEVLRTIMAKADDYALLVAINDKIADGRDVSWLWDVDFEELAKKKDALAAVSVSGLRAWDMAVRFKYAGFDPQQLSIEEKTDRALNHILQKTPPGGTLFILPTYTAMLEIRSHLNRMGFGKPYWEEH
jgi:lipid II isoglutaminyl synthase (glutamine-hydrolysing)